jgi:hypothetical protein
MKKSDSEVLCKLSWKLARRHGWGNPISKQGLADLALKSSNEGRGRELIDSLVSESFVGKSQKGYYIPNDPDSQAVLAFRLRDTCGYTEVQIEATLSRFNESGGFDEYEGQDMIESDEGW